VIVELDATPLMRIVSAPEEAFASMIACRRDPAPLSAVLVTLKVAPDASVQITRTPASE
jgi:hypothetical protein